MSRTSAGPPADLGFSGLDLVGLNLVVEGSTYVGAWSNVDKEGALFAKAGLDMLPLPSRASRRSVTPTPRDERDRLCNDRFSICIKDGASLKCGEIPSRRNGS